MVRKIEGQNNIGINLFEYKEHKKNDILPIYHTDKIYEDCINILVISDNDKKGIIMYILRI